MDTYAMIEVMEKYREGKKIQVRNVGSNDREGWQSVYTPSWDWENYDYRVHIELLEAFYWEYLDNSGIWYTTSRRYAEFEFKEIAEQGEYEEYGVIDSSGTKMVEDKREILEEDCDIKKES